MNDLAEFLLARIDEDERAAQLIGTRNEPGYAWLRDWISDRQAVAGEDAWRFAKRFGPSRLLAECDAKRQIVERYVHVDRRRKGHPDQRWPQSVGFELWHAVRLLALPYADHPDYQ